MLQAAGFEAVHWSTLGAPDATDEAIMAHAARQGLVVLTHDLDFGAILAATGGAKPSVVQIRADNLSPDVIGEQIVAALKQASSDLAEGALLSVDTARTRLRLLPLRRG